MFDDYCFPCRAIADSRQTGLVFCPTQAARYGSRYRGRCRNGNRKGQLIPALIPIYLGKHTDPAHPYASPLFGDYVGMPPLLLQVGDAEVLRDDSTRLANRASAQGCDVTLDIRDGMPHVYQGFAPFLPEAEEAIAKIGAFVRRH